MKKIAIVGATGVVGRKIIDIIKEYELDCELTLFASRRSKGKIIKSGTYEYEVLELNDQVVFSKYDIAIFSAGKEISLIYGPLFSESGCYVIDNSSAFRNRKDIPLIVPEVNIGEINKYNSKLIANPNCSTIQSVVALNNIVKSYKVDSIEYNTYQAVSGSGNAGIADYFLGLDCKNQVTYPYPIYNNLIPQIDEFTESGYTLEELKMINETKKILTGNEVLVTATCVRVPVVNSHSVNITVNINEDVTLKEIKNTLGFSESVVLLENDDYPMPILSNDTDIVFVGRVRENISRKNSFHIFTSADNIRKGAASNSVQIAKYLIEEKYV